MVDHEETNGNDRQNREIKVGGDVKGAVFVSGNGNVIFTEALSASVPPMPKNISPAFRILTVAPRALDIAELPDIADGWSLADGLQAVQAPVRISFLQPPTYERLGLVLDNGWDVLHFDGPVIDEAGGGLFFETEDGLGQLVSADDFIALLRQTVRQPRLVILSASQSARGTGDGLAGKLARDAGIPAVIGFLETVPVNLTKPFLERLYAALGMGRSIADSFDGACASLENFRDVTLPPENEGGSARIIPARDFPVLTGSDTNQALCPGGQHGAVLIEHGSPEGVPAPSESGCFYGVFRAGDPPTGRKGLLVRAARALLHGEKMIVLSGQGGIGKSALAAVLARRMAWRFPGGVFWVGGSSYQSSNLHLDDALDVFAACFDDNFLKAGATQKRQFVLAHLARMEKPCLWIIDGAEAADEAVWQVARQVGGRSAVLLTSREKPEYGGRLFDVDGIALEEALPFLVQEVRRRKNDPLWGLALDNDSQAVRGLTEVQTRQLREIVRLVDGHTLALLHAAALIADEGLGKAEKLVKANPAGGEVTQRFDFSYTRLTVVETNLLQRLAAFAADFDLAAVDEVCKMTLNEQDSGLLSEQEDVLRELTRKSFVNVISWSEDYRRYRLHPVMREFVRAKAAGKMASFEWNMACYYLGLAGAARSLLGEPKKARAAVAIAKHERLNLLTAQQVCLDQGRAAAVISFAYRLDKLFERSGHWDARRRALESGLRVTQNTDGPDRAALLHNMGMLEQDTGNYAQAHRLYLQSLEINERLGDRAGVAYTLGQLGILAYLQADYKDARDFYKRVLEISRDLKDRGSEGRALHQLGLLADVQGECAEAYRLYSESLDIARQLEDKVAVASGLHQLGNLAYQRGDNNEAHRLYSESRDISQQLEDQTGLAQTLFQLGMLAEKESDYPEAQRWYRESLQIKQLLGDKLGEARCLYRSGLLAEKEGDLESALEQLRRAEKIFSAFANPELEVVAQDCKRIEMRFEKKE